MIRTFSSAGALILALVWLSGCPAGSGSRDFSRRAGIVKPAGALSGTVAGESASGAWSLADARKINVSVCLLDEALGQSPGQKSWRVTGDGILQDAVSTTAGCLSWLETVAFDPAATPRYVNFVRTISSVNGAFEPLQVAYLLNPWSGLVGQEPVLVDPKYDSPVSGQGAGKGAALVLNLVEHVLLTQPALALNLRFAARLQAEGMDGSAVPLAVESGTVNVRAQLLYNDGKSMRGLGPEVSIRNQKFSNGTVDLQGLALKNLPDLDKTKGSFVLRLRVEPVNAPKSLRGVSADVALGDWKGLHAGAGLGADTGTQPPAIKVSDSPGTGFALSPVEGRTNGPVDENTILRRIQLSLKVHVQGSSFNESLEGESFTVSSVDRPGLLYTVKVKDGVLTWQDVVVHNYYQAMSRPLVRDVIFTRVKTGTKIAKTLDLTPWVRFMIVVLDGAQHNQDVSPKPAPIGGATDRRPQVRLEAPCMSQGDVRYAVDPATLGLRVNLHPFFQFTPRVRRYDEPFFGMNTFDAAGLRPGYYKLTLAVFNLDRENWEEPVLITQKVVTVLGGNLSLQLALQSRELSVLRLRNYVAAQIDFLDPNSLKAGADGQMTGRVMDDRELGVSKPVNVFPLVFSADSCATSPATESLSNPSVRRLAEKIRDKKLDLLQLAAAAQRTETPSTGTYDAQNWRKAAQSWGFTPVELARPGDEAQLGFDEPRDLKKVQEGLECAYMIGEQDAKRPATCQYNNNEPFGALCRALAIKWADMVNQAVQAGPHNGWERPQNLSIHFFRACYGGEAKNHLVVRKFIQAGGIEGADDVQVLGGSPAFEIGLKNQFMIGTDHGTEFMHEDNNRLTEALKLPALSRQKIFNAFPGGALQGVLKGKAVEKFAKSQESFRWIFNYEIPYTAAGLTSSTSLTMEGLDVKLRLAKFRECYTVEPFVDAEFWEIVLVPFTMEQAPKPRLYVCFPEVKQKIDIPERYFFAYNNPPAGGNGAMIDTDRAANRWFLTFRGERDFGVFMRNLRPHIKNIYRDGNEVIGSAGSIAESARAASLMDGTAFPGVIAAPLPGRENYDSIYNLEGYVPKIVRWISETLNPFEDYGQKTAVDQNSPDTRVYRGGTER